MLKLKVAPNFPNITQKVSTSVFANNGMFYRNSPKVTKHFRYFCDEIYVQEMQKIGQSGHTVPDRNIQSDFFMSD